MAETSTGVFERGDAICKAAHEVGAIVIADCVTSLGAMPVEVGQNRHRHRLQLHAEGSELSSRTVADYGFAARHRMLAGAHHSARSWYFDLGLSPTTSRLASLSSHRIRNHVLRIARRSDPHRGGRPGGPLGAPSPRPPAISSKRWKRSASRCWFPKDIASGT